MNGFYANSISLAIVMLTIIAGFCMWLIPTDAKEIVLAITTGIAGLATGVGVGVGIGTHIANKKGNESENTQP